VAAVADGCVERSDLVARVGDDQLVTLVSTLGADRGQGAADLGGVQDDLAALVEGVEDLTRFTDPTYATSASSCALVSDLDDAWVGLSSISNAKGLETAWKDARQRATRCLAGQGRRS
jgi:hypothetical protein